MKRTIKTAQGLLCAAVVVSAISCKKKDSADTAATTPVEEDPAADPTPTPAAAAAPQPGAVILALDGAMGSIGFAGQAAASLALTSSWTDEHCRESGNAVKSEYMSDRPVAWGCLLAVKTDGPDTPRGGVNRVKQVSCSLDKAAAAGTFAVDGAAHTFKMAVDAECWGADFVEMAKKELPKALNAETGNVEVSATVTGYTAIPADWSDVPTEWGSAYQIEFGFGEGETTTYKMLLRSDATLLAASILAVDSDQPERIEIFAMSIKQLTGGAAEFRYEGRFPFGKTGDGGYSSDHMRVLVSGPYSGGAFSSITSGQGYEASMYGNESDGALNSGSIKTFKANADGIGTRDWNLAVDGAVSNGPDDDWGGSSGSSPDDYTYTATTAQKASLLTTSVGAFTGGAAWQKAHGPLDYSSADMTD